MFSAFRCSIGIPVLHMFRYFQKYGNALVQGKGSSKSSKTGKRVLPLVSFGASIFRCSLLKLPKLPQSFCCEIELLIIQIFSQNSSKSVGKCGRCSSRNVGALKRSHLKSMQPMVPINELNPNFRQLHFSHLQ